ncbi:HNH endonuclease signature motif containing protein [Rhodococcus sp. IEGM 1330]|uniref:HNH endonuclease signature motif containing protein n=1 Tax=Rhodococcus sp. IEGM 1330 TaxID=3082225 RepID=UPI0029538FCE|nr:DUF222 domain-containing protein [Rhodococcus sp. IEGM 1330]MDV8021808.1 DUF222 domain-containing protein [Rhodococcus sp. IEGM 1330]
MADDHSALADVLGARRTSNAAAASELALMDDYVHGRTACASPWDTGVTEKDLYSSAICELAAAMSSTFAAIHNKLQMWRQLRPLVRSSFINGSLDKDRVKTIHDHLLHARPETVVAIEAEVLKAAGEMAPGTLGREIDRLLIEADAEWDRAVRKRAARTEKRIRVRRRARGLSSLTTVMTDGEADEQLSRIDAEVTRLHPEDPRSDDQRRGDAQTALMRGETLVCECSTCLTSRGDVAIPETAEPQPPGATETSTASSESAPQGPVRPIRQLPPDATPPEDTAPPDDAPRSRPGGGTLIERWRTIVESNPLAVHALHPDGHGGMTVPPPGALSYKPSRALATQIRADHPYCLHPGCDVPSDRCDLDHIVEFDRQNPERGGWTIPTNIGPRCRLHHNLKTRKLWRTELLPEGVLHIVDPLGRHYFTAPTL